MDKFSGDVSLLGQYLIITPTDGDIKGKKIQTLWFLGFGPETKLLAWAWGIPGGNPPDSYDSAMTTPNNAEFAMASCMTGKDKKICNFDN